MKVDDVVLLVLFVLQCSLAAAPADCLAAKLLHFATGSMGTLKSFWLPLIEQKKLI